MMIHYDQWKTWTAAQFILNRDSFQLEVINLGDFDSAKVGERIGERRIFDQTRSDRAWS